MNRKMPPFSALLKSREVEDPVNVWVHRPFAYAFARLVYRTPMTPNMVTFLAMIVGVSAGVCFVVGTRSAMIVGGMLLWASAILDGADGILARAKNLESTFGRAIDGAADTIVAVCTVIPAFYHLWIQNRSLVELSLMLPAIVAANVHLVGYDFYKESYLQMTRLDRGAERETPARTRERVEEARAIGWAAYLSMRIILAPYTETQQKIIRAIDPRSLRDGFYVRNSPVTADVYQRENHGPMQLWAVISLAPHNYLMAICAMFDNLALYLWIRVVLMNVLFGIVVVWQRRATARTEAELVRLGALAPASELARRGSATPA